MMKWKWYIPLSCLIVVHTPDGNPISIDTRHIVAVRPATAIKQHLAPGTKTVIYATTQNFGVIENEDEVDGIIHNCRDGQ